MKVKESQLLCIKRLFSLFFAFFRVFEKVKKMEKLAKILCLSVDKTEKT